MPTDTKRILVFDPQTAGISGDMIVGALLDLGADASRVLDAMKTPEHFLSGCRNLEITVEETTRKGMRAKKVEVKADEEIRQRTGAELLEALSNSMQESGASDEAIQFARTAIDIIVTAEARAHGQNTRNVHLHETASVDTLVDIIGAAVALDDLGLLTNTTAYSTPVAVGGGLFNFSHGAVSSPAPATLEILRSSGMHMVGGPAEAELATPTGVSLLAALAPEPVRFYPPMKPTGTGHGAGAREFTDMPNILRITLGEPCSYGLLNEEVYVIETNLDDITGEVLGHAMDILLREGARDVSAIPMVAKKGRPGYTIRVIADTANLERMCRLLAEETGTLGVRLYRCERRVLDRESLHVEITVGTVNERINVKVARTAQGQIIRMKPEYEDVKRLAAKTGKPLREIEALVKQKAADIIGS